MFWKRNSFSDSSRATSTQTVVNTEKCKMEEKDSETDSDKESIHSNWSKLFPIEPSKPDEALTINVPQRKRTVRNIVLVPYKPKLKDWGSWKIKSPYATSTVASPILDSNNQVQTSNQNNEEKLIYVPHSQYYELVHSPQFYGMSELIVIKLTKREKNVKFLDNYSIKLVLIYCIINMYMITNINMCIT